MDKRIALGLSAAALAIFMPAAGCPGQPWRWDDIGCEDAEFHYQDIDLQERPLVLDPTRIWLSAPQGLSGEAEALLIQAGIQPGDLEVLGETGSYLAAVPERWSDACGVRDLVGILAEEPTFDSVSPVFFDRTEAKVVHSQLFVTFVSDVGKEEAEQILIDAQTHGLSTEELAAGFQQVSTLTRNGFTVLEIASELSENPRVVEVQPYLIWPWPYDD